MINGKIEVKDEKLMTVVFKTLKDTVLPAVCCYDDLVKLIKDRPCFITDYEDGEQFNINYEPVTPIMLDKYTQLNYILFGYSRVDGDTWKLDSSFDYYLVRTITDEIHGEVQL